MAFFSQVAGMNQVTQKNSYIALYTLAISVLVVFLSFNWQGNKGFNLWDEGYLWYGVQRVLQNEVPILDFLAYDPGRYYWSAAFLKVSGDDGIMTLRTAVAIFQAAGLFVGLLLVAQSAKVKGKADIVFWLIAVATLVVWMFPRHKLFDISISVFLIGVLTYLISNPIPKRYVIAGACVGLIAVFGRNHGVYGAIGSLLDHRLAHDQASFWLRFYQGYCAVELGSCHRISSRYFDVDLHPRVCFSFLGKYTIFV